MNRSHHNEIMRMASDIAASRDCDPFEYINRDAFEADIERIFGSGDEVQVKPVNTSQALIASGHSIHDF